MKKYLGFICLLYAGIILYVWYMNYLDNFLSPQMQIYIKISSILIFLIGWIILFSNSVNYKFKVSDLVLVLPLVMIIGAGDGNLGLSLATNRMGNFNNTITIIEEDPIEETGKPVIEVDNKVIDFEVIDENYEYLANYLTFSEKALKFKGKSIKVKGFSITNASYLPSGYFALGKYIISCCAADATFAGFYVKYDLSKIKNNTWYEIEGTFNSGKDPSGHSIMYINVSKIMEVQAGDKEQYAYPCYVYDEGMCRAVTKYDIDFEV